jgi:transposase
VASVAPSPALLNTQLMALNVALEEELRVARAELRELRKRTAQQDDTIADLLKTQRQLTAKLEHLLEVRRRPDLVDPNQGLLFGDPLTAPSDESKAEEEKPAPEPPPKKRRKSAGPSRRVADESNLRREIVRSELPPDERRCPSTGVELVEVGVKVSKEIDYRRGELVVVEHHQVIYGPPPEVAAERNIEPVLAPAPPVAVEGVTASATLLAWLIYQKYVLHLPLYRLEQVFAELGLRLARTTLSDWVQKVAFALRLVRDEIERQVRAGPVLSFDDTVTKCFVINEATGRRKLKQARLWVFVNPEVPGVVFRFTTGRGADDLVSILSTPEVPTSVKVILSDGLAVNRAGTLGAGLQVAHAGCWAHVLRKFRDAKDEAPAMAKLFLDGIDKIYEVEATGKGKGDAKALTPTELLALRRGEAMPLVIDLLRMTSDWKKKYSLKGKMAEAMRYLRSQRHSLLTFLRDGQVPIDNNACERAIRPIAIGRNNWLFAGSEDGGDTAAILYTIVESARASGVDPQDYLLTLLRRIGTHPASQVSELTPWAMASELQPYRGHRSVV